MLQCNSSFLLKISKPEVFESQLQKDLEEYEIKFKSFPKIWEINNPKYKHTLDWHKDKESKLISKRKENSIPYRLPIALVTILSTFVLLYFRPFSFDIVLIIAFLIILTLDFIYPWFSPSIRDNLKNEHQYLLRKIQLINQSNIDY
jgi:hypothetical protein